MAKNKKKAVSIKDKNYRYFQKILTGWSGVFRKFICLSQELVQLTVGMVIRDHAVAQKKDLFTTWLLLVHATISNGRHLNLIKALTAQSAFHRDLKTPRTTRLFTPVTTQQIMRANSLVAAKPVSKAKSSAYPTMLPVPIVFYSSSRRFQLRRAFTNAQIWPFSRESLLIQWLP